MSQMNEENEGSNVVGGGKVDTNPTGVKLGEPQRRKIEDDMRAALKERAVKNFSKGSKKQ